MQPRLLAALAGGAALVAFAMPAQAAFTETTYGSAGGNVNNLADADAAIAGGPVLGTAPSLLINWGDQTVNDGNIPGDTQVPGVFGADDYVSQTVGTITVQHAGTFTFTGASDDGERLRIDGSDVFVDNGQHPVQNTSGTVSLTAGPHTLEYVWFERAGGASGDLVYTAPGLPLNIPVTESLIPEPASLGLLGIGALGLVARRRRQA